MAGTRWVRLDIDYYTNPKVLAAGRAGRELHIASIVWCGRHLTDGFIPAAVVPVIVAMAGVPRAAVDRLVAAGLWVALADGNYLLHDFTEMNGTRADAEKAREAMRDRQRRWRGQHKNDNESDT